jgi:hypothetical protein
MVSVVQLRPQVAGAALEALAEGLARDERALLARTLEFAEPLYAGQALSTGERFERGTGDLRTQLNDGDHAVL